MSNRAIVVRRFGSPETFALESIELAAPAFGEVRIRVHAAGVSFVDVLTAEGGYQVKPALPFVPGSEFSGVIEAVGEGTDVSRIGQRVYASGFGGAFSDAAIVPADAAFPMPEAMSFEEAAIFRVSYATGCYALRWRGQLKAGEHLCVLGAGGAVGYACVQIGKALGATVIASASTPEKRALALAGGADHVIDSGAEDWRAQLKAATGGRGPDVVADPLGGPHSEPAFRSLAWNGRHLVIGFAAGEIPRLATNLALVKGASLIGVDIRQFGLHEPGEAAKIAPALLELYSQGRLKPPIGRFYPLEDYAVAMNEARSGATAGRIVLCLR